MSSPSTEDVTKAIETFVAQDNMELDWCYDGGTGDAVSVANTLARYYIAQARSCPHLEAVCEAARELVKILDNSDYIPSDDVEIDEVIRKLRESVYSARHVMEERP